MDLTFLTEAISPVALGIALVIGFLIKYAITDNRINHFIPIICAVVGLVVVTITDALAGTFTMNSILTGLISGLAATGLFEAFKQLFNIKTEEEQ